MIFIPEILIAIYPTAPVPMSWVILLGFFIERNGRAERDETLYSLLSLAKVDRRG
jgi:hypothetical protein